MLWCKQICDALHFLNQKKIVHRDLKPQNILVFSDNLVKISDLGEAKEFDDGDDLRTFKGTRNYMAPEIEKDN